MRIKYNVTIDDLVAFNQFYHKHSAYGRRIKRTWGLVFPLGLFLFFCLIGVSQKDWVAPIVGGVFAGLIIWGNAGGGWRKRIGKTVRKMYEEGSNKSAVGLHELELNEYGIIVKDQYGESTHSWDGIERLGFTPDYTFIFISSVAGFSIRGTTVVEGDYSAFVSNLKQRFDEHKKDQDEATAQKDDLSEKVISDSAEFYQPDTGFGKHSGYGIASLAIAIILGGLYVMLFLSFFILGFFAPATAESPSVLLMVVGSIFMLGFFGNLAGLGLGIAGACQKNRKNTLAVLGIVFNSVALFLFTILILIGSTR